MRPPGGFLRKGGAGVVVPFQKNAPCKYPGVVALNREQSTDPSAIVAAFPLMPLVGVRIARLQRSK